MTEIFLNQFTYEYYAKFLQAAQESGYVFGGFDDIDILRKGPKPSCILRHDCDNNLMSARRLAKLEYMHHVQSTYFIMTRSTMYNPFSGPSSEIIDEILSQGHRIGLHFDEQLMAEASETDLAEEVAFECNLLAHYFKTTIVAVSFHRPGQRILDDRIKIDYINTYSKRDLQGFQYISDSAYVERLNLPRAFAIRYFEKVHLNLHPEWWGESPGSSRDRWEGTLRENLTAIQDDLWNREVAFPQRFSFVFEPVGDVRSLPEDRIYSVYQV